MPLQSTTIILALVWRVFVSVFTRTFFQPDEYFQSLEVAHHVVFGYGHLTWEWRANPPIRSIVYPLVYVPVYWVLKVTGLDDSGYFLVRVYVLCIIPRDINQASL